MVEFSDSLFTSDDFYKSIYNSLTSEGVFVSQVGIDDENRSFPDYMLPELNIVERLSSLGYRSIKLYGEAHGGFFAPWKFMISFKGEESYTNWYRNQAEIDLIIADKLLESNDGNDSLLRYYDGATHLTYLYPSRLNENKFCLTLPKPVYCEYGHGYNPDLDNIKTSSVEVKISNIEGAGRGIIFKEDFKKGTYIAIDEGSHSLLFMPTTTYWIQSFGKKQFMDIWKTFDYYMFGYGFSSDYFGGVAFTVDQSILTFINHGCNNTYNMGVQTGVTEITADFEKMPPVLHHFALEDTVYSPFIDRNVIAHVTAYDQLLKDVKVGDELLDNYLSYLNMDNWKSGLSDYRAQCLKQAVGAITNYEKDTIA